MKINGSKLIALKARAMALDSSLAEQKEMLERGILGRVVLAVCALADLRQVEILYRIPVAAELEGRKLHLGPLGR